MAKKRGLGRGLEAVLKSAETDITSNKKESKAVAELVGNIALLPIEAIVANPFQPRTRFQKQPLLELSESIKVHGIIQPVTVRKIGHDKFELISGERRFRASQIAGLEEIPAYIRIANDQTMLEMALVENIQRENLDAIEVAISYKRLLEECNLTQEQLSQKVGKSRSAVTNYIRLLKLPAEIQLAIMNNTISMGHARALISISEAKLQMKIFKQCVNEGLSVRQVEVLVKGDIEQKNKKAESNKMPLSLSMQKVQEDLKYKFGKKSMLKSTPEGNGKIEISFNSETELQNIIDLLEL